MMVTLVLWLMSAHLQTIYLKPGSPVSVVACKGRTPIALYADEKMRTVLPNPVSPDQHGTLRFWIAKSQCVEVAPTDLPTEIISQ